MITTPDRIGEAIAALERGEQVDWGKLRDLQALDLAQVGRKFMEQAVLSHEAELDALEQIAKG